MRVLGFESSCDETGVAIYEAGKGLIAEALHSQISLHQGYGGVVPELASRDHVKYLVPLVDEVLQQAQLKKEELDAIAYTAGPGLIGALLTGASFAKSLAFALGKPALAIHHLEAHLLAALLDCQALEFPFIALLVSGGHTQLIEVQQLNDYQLLGETLDDAVGEAFDKTAKLMGFSYPGGAKLAESADNCPASLRDQCTPFPRPMLDRKNCSFSFSGLKTHALTVWQKSDKSAAATQAIAWHFQQAIIDTLVAKAKRALQAAQHRRLVVAGGVAANLSLRQALQQLMVEEGGQVYFPQQRYCTDNGAMVAYAGYLHLVNQQQDKSHAIEVRANWPLA